VKSKVIAIMTTKLFARLALQVPQLANRVEIVFRSEHACQLNAGAQPAS